MATTEMPNLTYLFILFFQATLLVTAAWLVSWLCSLKLGNAGIIDVVWCGLFTPLALSYAGLSDGYSARRILITAMVCIWSMRLATHLAQRLRAQMQEHSRYAELRRSWGKSAESRFLALFLIQSALCLVLSAPFALICLNPARRISPLEWAGAAIWLVGFLGESISDRQLAHFKMDLANRGKALGTGLWKYSRHPNYFSEWVVWCGYFVFALGSPWGWVAIYCPIIMYYVLTRVTGIPMAEAQALRSRGEAYRTYQERTSAFFPCTPKA